jgi:hypothetical protein
VIRFPPGATQTAQRSGRCAWQESNLRPRAPEARALSPELQALRLVSLAAHLSF